MAKLDELGKVHAFISLRCSRDISQTAKQRSKEGTV